MLRSSVHPIASVFAAALLFAPSSFAFNFPLSDQAVREAYFRGQRRDETFATFLDKYVKHLAPPKSGPYISSITFSTPFAQLAQLSFDHIGSYSAQQAALDHRGQGEFVRIVIEIQLTPTYGPFLVPQTSSRSSSPVTPIPRPQDFWRDFQVQISDDSQLLTPSGSHGKANYHCGRHGPCSLIGATLEFEFPAESFTSDSATILVVPPEGSQVSVDFNLITLR
jgi:hypothetical protein